MPVDKSTLPPTPPPPAGTPLTAKGNISTKKSKGRTYRRHMFIEKIVRLDQMGWSEDQIALHLGITKQYVSMNKRTPEFISKRIEIMTGVISEIDKDLRLDTENFTAEVKQMVPDALLAIREALYDRSNPRIRFEAAKQVLDREGTTSVVSKSEIKKTFELDMTKHDETAVDLLTALSQMREAAEASGSQTVPGSEVFKNSSLSKSQQADMYDQIKIEDFELPKSSRVQ